MLLTVGLATLSLLLDSVTRVLLGAGATSVTVPVTLLPPLIVLGLTLNDATPITTVVFALSVLFDNGSGSLAVTLAVLVIVPVAFAFTMMVRLALWSLRQISDHAGDGVGRKGATRSGDERNPQCAPRLRPLFTR